VAVAIAVLAAAVFFIVHSTRARMDRNRATRAAISARWDVAAKTLGEVSDNYSAYLASPVDMAFTRPLLDEPLTATFLTAYSEARAAAYDSRPADLEAADRAARTADDALTVWKRASSHAREVALGTAPDQYKKLSRARRLFDQALDPSISDDHRDNILQRVRTLLAEAGATRSPNISEIAYNAVTRSLTTAEKKQLTKS
jgi:hypothetical protein